LSRENAKFCIKALVFFGKRRKIPENFDYNKIKSMSIEAKQKLSKIRPITISQASRISGVSPSDVSVLLIYMGR